MDGYLTSLFGIQRYFFYNLVQKKIIDWTIFFSGLLSRFDLYYSRNNKTNDKISVTDFLENCHRKLKQTNKNVSFDKNFKGLILKIGSRRSNCYSRIYEIKNSLKFEDEMKGKFLQKYHLLLVGNRLDEFEQKLSSHFSIYFGKLLPLHFYYLDWLVIKLRPIRKQPIFQSGLNSDYVKPEISLNIKTFVMFLQYLDFEIQCLGGITYRQVSFKLRDFLQFQNPVVKSTNHYQLEKVKNFLQQLQTGVFLTSFDDTYFQSLVAIPQVKFEKCPKQKCWIGKVSLVEELFSYTYPFYWLLNF